ncbi:MAG: hypothetical protein MJA83_00960, partial [Gammaproteobacteria bacterium]|nr:hypothetical protein [Gammaproteobacteria bacterium]
FLKAGYFFKRRHMSYSTLEHRRLSSNNKKTAGANPAVLKRLFRLAVNRRRHHHHRHLETRDAC